MRRAAPCVRHHGAVSEPPAVEQRYVHGMERLVEAVQQLSLARDLARVQEVVRSAARDLTGCDGASFVLRDGDQCFYADESAIAPLWKGSRFPIESCISGWSMLHGETTIIPDIYADDRIPHEAYRPTFVKSLVMVPIRTVDPIGAIGNYWAAPHTATADEVRLLQALADSASIAMENIAVHDDLENRVRQRTADLERANREIEQLSITDDLTGVLNRRGFGQKAAGVVDQARQHGLTLVVIYLDVDGLKLVNDVHGHEQGNGRIAAVAGVLRSTVRSDDVVARMGGDEFCVVAAVPPGEVDALHGRVLDRFDEYNRGRSLDERVSVSVGVAAATGDEVDLDRLIASADLEMYAVKRGKATPHFTT